MFNLTTPIDVCIQRVYQRNGGKPIKEESVASKHKVVMKNIEAFKNEGFISLKFDPSKLKKEDVLKEFFNTLKKYEEK